MRSHWILVLILALTGCQSLAPREDVASPPPASPPIQSPAPGKPSESITPTIPHSPADYKYKVKLVRDQRIVQLTLSAVTFNALVAIDDIPKRVTAAKHVSSFVRILEVIVNSDKVKTEDFRTYVLDLIKQKVDPVHTAAMSDILNIAADLVDYRIASQFSGYSPADQYEASKSLISAAILGAQEASGRIIKTNSSSE